MDLEDRPSHANQVIAQQTCGTLVLMSIGRGQYYSLNELGSRIWQLCDGARSVAEIIQIIGDEYDVSPDRVQHDVLRLLQELAGERLVESNDQVAPGR
jgi:hypothetical protein